MKNALKWKAILKIAGLFALVAVIGFGVAGCDNGSDPPGGGGGGGGGGEDAFTGTWIAPAGSTGNNSPEMKLVAANLVFRVYNGEREAYRGTYIVSGGEVTIVFVEVNVGLFTGEADRWDSYVNAKNEGIKDIPPEPTMEGTISNDTFTIPGDKGQNIIFTKQK